MKQRILLLVLALPFLFFSCDYSPSGEHYEEINPKPAVLADLTLHPDKDTLYVRGLILFDFSISLPGRALRMYQLKLDGTLLTEGYKDADTHAFISGNYGNGFHTLQLSAQGNSGTGSLADKVGAEVLEVYRTWTIYIENGPPAAVAITKVEPENGTLRLEWQQSSWRTFAKYELYRIRLGGPLELMASISDVKQTSWRDTTYIGGLVSYWITVSELQDSYDKYTTGPTYTYHYPLPTIVQQSYDAAHRLTVAFTTTPFYKNFESYALTSPQGLSYLSEVQTDTVVTFEDPGFGTDFAFRLVAYPKKVNKEYYYNTHSTYNKVAGYGTAWGPQPLASLWVNTQENLFYTGKDNWLEVTDASTLQVKHKRRTSFHTPEFPHLTVSANGQHVYAIENDTVYKLDPRTLESIAIYRIQALLSADGFYGNISLEGCSNTNRLVIGAKTSSYRDSIYVVDMHQKKLLKQQHSAAYPRETTISPDGKALRIYDAYLVEQGNGNWQKQAIGDTETTLRLIFHPDKPWYGIQTDTRLEFYAIHSGALQTAIATEVKLNRFSIDAASGFLYGTAENTLYVYNLETGRLVRKQKLAQNGIDIFLFKDKIFSSDRYIPL
ncbi:hypothetical protein MKJ04_18045 [Pontibacter sp. E15-1]|uniref:YncE family protein n=1 Tax=Pontibacter sp. E15-1 TaxID=2919918 RepID=UPI001F4F70B1|nr:hypothetical protein [Pontibacter sp. E15-1]MCJ8166754.1 hypothetical protein [Pontibacter sp. E15-1]